MTDLLHRLAPASTATGRTVHGLAVPYGVATDVSDDGRTAYRERFAAGAFTRSIRERGDKVKLFGLHDTRRFPIGRATELREDSAGLHAAFELPATAAADEALELVRSGVVDGFSVGFRPIVDRRDGEVTVRVEAALHEVSLVHSPAYSTALVAGVRSAEPPLLLVEVARRRLDLLLRL